MLSVAAEDSLGDHQDHDREESILSTPAAAADSMRRPVARPLLLSPRILPKRPLEASSVSLDEMPVAKCAKQQPQQPPPNKLKQPQRTIKPFVNAQGYISRSLDGAVEAAIRLYKEVFTQHALESECGPAPYHEARDARAFEMSERWAEENYEAMRKAVAGLLPWVGVRHAAAAVGVDYDVLRFQGRRPPRHLSRTQLPDDCEHDMVMKQLREFRSSGPENRARDALLTLCAALSCRKEKCWMELYDNDLKREIKKFGLRRTKSKKMRNLTETFVADLIEKEEWCCQFARALVMPESSVWMAFARGQFGTLPVPASLIVAHRMPLWDVFVKMEEESPLYGEASKGMWWTEPGRQLSFQEVIFEDAKKERKSASGLEAEPQLRMLLRSKKPVVYLDMLAALAPREVSKLHGVGDIIRAELFTLFREAKARGEAVIFALGSGDPRKLAQKVYLRDPLTDFGLRCGFFRWRESADAPWARERAPEDRTLMMLQMP